jgi:hypothetical protein
MSASGTHGGAEHAAQPPALCEFKTSENLNVALAASGVEVNCVQVTYDRCSPVGITELLIERAKKEPPGTRLALLQIWKLLMAKLGAKTEPLETLWVKGDLDPEAIVTPEDRARAETAAEEALAPCRLCVVDLPTFLRLVRRTALAAKPSGDLTLVVEVECNGDVAVVATKLGAWIKRTKEGIEYVMPLVFRENLRRLGLEVDANPYDLYVELTRRAEYYATVVDAYLRPILLQALERLRASPYSAKCARDGKVIYIASELFRAASWYFNSSIGLGRNSLYETFRRYGLLASPTTVSIALVDEFGNRVKKRALAFLIERLSEFVEYDVSVICQASWLEDEAEEGGHA